MKLKSLTIFVVFTVAILTSQSSYAVSLTGHAGVTLVNPTKIAQHPQIYYAKLVRQENGSLNVATAPDGDITGTGSSSNRYILSGNDIKNNSMVNFE